MYPWKAHQYIQIRSWNSHVRKRCTGENGQENKEKEEKEEEGKRLQVLVCVRELRWPERKLSENHWQVKLRVIECMIGERSFFCFLSLIYIIQYFVGIVPASYRLFRTCIYFCTETFTFDLRSHLVLMFKLVPSIKWNHCTNIDLTDFSLTPCWRWLPSLNMFWNIPCRTKRAEVITPMIIVPNVIVISNDHWHRWKRFFTITIAIIVIMSVITAIQPSPWPFCITHSIMGNRSGVWVQTTCSSSGSASHLSCGRARANQNEFHPGL